MIQILKHSLTQSKVRHGKMFFLPMTPLSPIIDSLTYFQLSMKEVFH